MREQESLDHAFIADKGCHCLSGAPGENCKSTSVTANAGQRQADQAPFTARPFAMPDPSMILTKNSAVSVKSGAVSQFKFTAQAAGKISGYGSVFGNIDQAGERVVRGAFAKSIARHKADGTAPLLLWQHRQDEPIGRWTDFREDDYGLLMDGELTLGSSRGRDAYEHVKAGDVSGLSIGYRVLAERQNGAVIDLTEIDLQETSVVSFPSNRAARLTSVKFESVVDVENALLDAGAPRAFARKFAAAGWAALINGEDDLTTTINLTPLAASAERAAREIKSLKELFR